MHRIKDGHELQLLCGPKIGGPCEGYLMATGGKIEITDGTAAFPSLRALQAGYREQIEESGISADRGRIVAIVNTRIKAKKEWARVHIVFCDQFSGRIKHDPKEFKWLKFLKVTDELLSGFPPGETEWMRRVLIHKDSRFNVSIPCGKNRSDVTGKVRIRRWKKRDVESFQ